ncbi:FERM, ARHGEF and pleckstrin domain-containing protein 1 isoform X4 [Danaus plexippus]|uniref:FERM, ARHGEF and pleckstrin domain-containing protein 1 isoform X4 n=1 Tax=Danaus plexippus TaxID=13037 RepID=UPI002AB2DE1F|nr:FERM, ARHGEF and pleckstrin domain-containing protein 1 isoform X4 [Danaus plexippus]
METELPPGSCNSTGHLSTIGWHMPGRMHHSASTPAGVDGGARTPPATPKKGGKMLAVRVQMLDDSISMFQIQSKAHGKVLFDQVCRQLHLLEADYFGLEYQDANGIKYWLDVEKPMCRQVGLSMLEPTLRFCVKFYTPDPARLEEEFTRYLFCLQVKRDLMLGCIQCNENTAALMASYIVQAECGDFVPEDYPDHTYLSGYKFFPGQDADSERRIMENHKKHIGQSPAEADLNLLETARRCELYGIKMHSAKDHEGVPLNLAVAHMGIAVFQHCTRINTFSWAKIRKISFKRKRFLIKLHPEGYGYFRDVVEFFFESRNECKNFWKKCVENHGFFRCTSVPRLPRHKTRVMSRGSSFRYSGKTQKQIVEFVRDNYVKRQTFQSDFPGVGQTTSLPGGLSDDEGLLGGGGSCGGAPRQRSPTPTSYRLHLHEGQTNKTVLQSNRGSRSSDPCRGQSSSYGGFASASSDDDAVDIPGEYLDGGCGGRWSRARTHSTASWAAPLARCDQRAHGVVSVSVYVSGVCGPPATQYNLGPPTDPPTLGPLTRVDSTSHERLQGQ